MLYKSFPATAVKLDDGEDAPAGQFEAIVSVFNNVDLVGDVIIPGAFAKSLAGYAVKSESIPVIWSHDWADPMSHLGKVLDAVELGPGDARLPESIRSLGGLYVKGQIDLTPFSDGSPNVKAEQVARLLRNRQVTEFSFAYDVVNGAAAERDGKSVFELRELEVHEVGPTLKGANPATELISAKTRGEKAGRVLSAKNEGKLAKAAELLREVLDSVEAATQDEGDGKAEDRSGGKAEDPTQEAGLSPADVRTTLQMLELQMLEV